MPNDLYERDALAWSEQQGDPLRRDALGKRVTGIDCAHVVEEIEDVGLSEHHAVESLPSQILVHLLKLQAWPDSSAAEHWRSEVVTFQGDAERRYAPSMRQRIDGEILFDRARRSVARLVSMASRDIGGRTCVRSCWNSF